MNIWEGKVKHSPTWSVGGAMLAVLRLSGVDQTCCNSVMTSSLHTASCACAKCITGTVPHCLNPTLQMPIKLKFKLIIY